MITVISYWPAIQFIVKWLSTNHILEINISESIGDTVPIDKDKYHKTPFFLQFNELSSIYLLILFIYFYYQIRTDQNCLNRAVSEGVRIIQPSIAFDDKSLTLVIQQRSSTGSNGKGTKM